MLHTSGSNLEHTKSTMFQCEYFSLIEEHHDNRITNIGFRRKSSYIYFSIVYIGIISLDYKTLRNPGTGVMYSKVQ